MWYFGRKVWYFGRKISKNNLKTIPSVINKSLSTTGKISRIGFEIKSGETYYYFTLTNLSDKYFMCTSLVSPEIILTKVGDKVKVNYEVYEGNQIDIIGFENLSLKD